MSQFVSSRYTSALVIELLRLHAENRTLRVQLTRSKEEAILSRSTLHMQESELMLFKDMFLYSPFSTVVVDPPTSRILTYNVTFLEQYGLQDQDVTERAATYRQFIMDPAAVKKYAQLVPTSLDSGNFGTLKQLWETPIPIITQRKDGSLMRRHIMGFVMHRFLVFVCCRQERYPVPR